MIAAYVIGLLAERGLERSLRTSIIPFLVGTVIIYACGVAWLTVVLGDLGRALAAGLIPFLIADAQAWKGGTQIAFMNPGGIRADIAYSSYPHDITYGDFFIVQPFDNKLVTMNLTGAQIYAVLE